MLRFLLIQLPNISGSLMSSSLASLQHYIQHFDGGNILCILMVVRFCLFCTSSSSTSWLVAWLCSSSSASSKIYSVMVFSVWCAWAGLQLMFQFVGGCK